MLMNAPIIGLIPASDAERARAFYEGMLGLSFLRDDGFAIVLKANHTFVRVIRMREFTPVPYTILGWEVTNIEETVAGLAAKGLAFQRYPFLPPDQVDALGIWTAPNGDRIAWFLDSEGNNLSLSQHGSGVSVSDSLRSELQL
jgi:catechol 2,3-dioxygenase-like lactoylglutathione lyase family enzyme